MNKKGNWEVSIRKTSNGFICEYEEEYIDETDGFKKEEVLFESKEEDNELETMKDVLWFVKDHFGVHWSKHNEKNLSIEVKEEKI